MALLESLPEFSKSFKGGTETIYSLNAYPVRLNNCIAKMLDCQMKTFNYRLLDSKIANNIIPEVGTNLKVKGIATVFDCVFTDI